MAGNNTLKTSFKRCTSAPDCNDSDCLNSIQMTTKNTNFSREHPSTPSLNIFAHRARRHSASFSQMQSGPRLTPRVSQLRLEECADILNSREVTHEREIHTAMQISQSCEDLTIDAESLSVKDDSDLTNPLHVNLSTGRQSCSSPSPTSRATMRLPYASPSPTRRTFATRRSMSPIAMRPSTLGPVKRKCQIDDNYGNCYSPPSFKKMFSEHNNSPICQLLTLTYPSPDSMEGRTTPKLYVSKLCATSTNSSSSLSSSPSASSPSMEIQMDLPTISNSEPIVALEEESIVTQNDFQKTEKIDDKAKDTNNVKIITNNEKVNDVKLSDEYETSSNSSNNQKSLERLTTERCASSNKFNSYQY